MGRCDLQPVYYIVHTTCKAHSSFAFSGAWAEESETSVLLYQLIMHCSVNTLSVYATAKFDRDGLLTLNHRAK